MIGLKSKYLVVRLISDPLPRLVDCVEPLGVLSSAQYFINQPSINPELVPVLLPHHINLRA